MEYTPIQLQAFCFIAEKRRARELAEQLHTNALAAQGDDKAIRKRLKELEDA
jgi:hypothetical protein